LANGKYIARMDSDDMMMPEKLEKQMKVLLANDSIDVIDTAAYTINENDEPIGMRGTADLSSWDRKKAFKKVLLFHPTVVAKADWYKKNKYDNDFIRSEDFELWCRTFDGTIFERVYEPLFLYREGKVNIKNYITSNRTHRKMLRKYWKGVLTKTELWIEIFRSHSKSGTYRFFSMFNLQHFLSSQRNESLTYKQKIAVIDTIKRIKAIEVTNIPESDYK
jgi:glycosyltransferase involved in cell wall biosynthesis